MGLPLKKGRRSLKLVYSAINPSMHIQAVSPPKTAAAAPSCHAVQKRRTRPRRAPPCWDEPASTAATQMDHSHRPRGHDGRNGVGNFSIVATARGGRIDAPGSVGLLRDSGRVLLEAAPEGVDLDDLRAHLLEDEHVHDVHDLHV